MGPAFDSRLTQPFAFASLATTLLSFSLFLSSFLLLFGFLLKKSAITPPALPLQRVPQTST
jgi:hypothetical protein